jgi:hypothetical protein
MFLCDKGILRPFPYGDIIVYTLQVMIITYSYMFEPDNLTRGFNRSIDQYCEKSFEERRGLFAI